MPKARAVLVDGIEYPSITAAGAAIEVSGTAVRVAISQERAVQGHIVSWAPPPPPPKPYALMPKACTSRQGVYREQRV